MSKLQHNCGAPHTHPRLQHPNPPNFPSAHVGTPAPISYWHPSAHHPTTISHSSRTSSKHTTSFPKGQRRRPPYEPTHRGTSSTTAAIIVGQPACRTIRPTITLCNDHVSIAPDSQQPVGNQTTSSPAPALPPTTSRQHNHHPTPSRVPAPPTLPPSLSDTGEQQDNRSPKKSGRHG